MPTRMTGDFSKYPDSIGNIFPYVVGETCELRQAWEVYSHLFMKSEEKTKMLGEHLGPLLGMFQSLLQDELFPSIARLTDRDSHSQANLSLWALLPAISHAKGATFGSDVRESLDRICAEAFNVRKHRHKRLAHFDMGVSLKDAALPTVKFKQLKGALEQIEEFLNLFYWEFERTTVLFDSLPAHDITGRAEATAYKARTYDLLEKEGVVQKHEWRRRIEES